ncbi:hypothetical protein D3C80_1297900 [compost metagenome]
MEVEGKAIWYGLTDVSAIVDLSLDRKRDGLALSPIANSNLIHAKTLLPQLRGTIGAGSTVLATAAMSLPLSGFKESFLVKLPACPEIAQLQAFFRDKGSRIPAFGVEQR